MSSKYVHLCVVFLVVWLHWFVFCGVGADDECGAMPLWDWYRLGDVGYLCCGGIWFGGLGLLVS